MQNKMIGVVAGIFIILAFGLVNTATAHTGSNDAIPSPNRQDYVYSNINAKCHQAGWNATDSSSNLGNDSDGDGICDGWELSTGLRIYFTTPSNFTGAGAGETFDYTHSCDQAIPGDCPSPDKKDVYLELDWMEDAANSHVPLDGVVQAVVDAWAASPVSNLDGSTGIRLHVQYGEWPAAGTFSQQGDVQWHKDLLYTNWSSSPNEALQGFYRLKQHTFGTMDERFADGGSSYAYNGTFQKNARYTDDAVKNPLTAKFQVFHYTLVINKRQESGQATSSGWGEIYGNDHVWSLGGWSPAMGNAEQQKAVFMHELGHNFNLDHGGSNTTPNKPNYFSVMNPVFQFAHPDGKDKCRPIDYSRKAMSSLNENSLSESAGVKDSSGAGYLYPSAPWSCLKSWTGNAAGASLADQGSDVEVAGTERFFWYSTPGSTSLNAFDRTNQAANWNNDVPYDDIDTGLSQSINADGTKATLSSTDDWSRILAYFDFGNSAYSTLAQAGNVTVLDPDAPPVIPMNEECPDIPPEVPQTDLPTADILTTGCRELTFEVPPPPPPVDPPLKQLAAGVAPEDVKCKTGLNLIFKVSDGNPACVKESTVAKLIERGWAKSQ